MNEQARPDVVSAMEAYEAAVRGRGSIAVEELERVLAERFSLDLDDPEDAAVFDEVDEILMADPGAPVALLAGDVVVHAPTLTAGAVLTHRLSAAEQAEGYLELDVDLAGFIRRDEHTVGGDALWVDDEPDGRVSWSGPLDWLADLPLEALLAVRVGADGEVRLDVLEAQPRPVPALVELLREVYDAEVEEPGLPVAAEDLVLGMLVRDPHAFDEPRPPLVEMAAAAGLEPRGARFAHDDEIWRNEAHTRRLHRLAARVPPGRLRGALVASTTLNDPASARAEIRDALDALTDPVVLEAVADELVGDDEDPRETAELVARLDAAAGSGPRAAVAGWIATVAAERGGRVLDAESRLRTAVREGAGWPFTEDRLAWYESDRGDAAAALNRWQTIGAPADDPDVAVLRPIVAAAGRDLGRNERCWCGSGRKFKQCHLGVPVVPPLPERVSWLCRKSVSYLVRRGGAAARDLDAARARFPVDVDEDLADQVILDVVLHEGGWFARFLAERGPLLPDDEALLGEAWQQVERTVYDVVDVRAGDGMLVRDLRTGERIQVTERTASRTVAVGTLLCARAVPDGVGHQFVGALVPIPPGRERQLLRVLDRGDAPGLLAWLAAILSPPEMLIDGEPPVHCTAILRCSGEPGETLDEHYRPSDLGWVWLDEQPAILGDRVLGTLQRDGAELTAFTATEGRMDRFLAELTELIPDAEVVHQERDPSPPLAPAEPAPLPDDLGEIQDRFERRWCEESVPALDGLTPREAVADPTRRADVERLIASFPEIDPSTGAFGMRPARLRELLGLE